MSDSTRLQEEIESVLGSKTMLKVFGTLARRPAEWQTVYAICKETGLNNRVVRENLASLINAGWAEKYGSTMIAKYRLNATKRQAKLLEEFLRESGYFDLDLWLCSLIG